MNIYNTPITNQKCIYRLEGYITSEFCHNVFFKVAKLTYELFDNEAFQYIFEPYYDVLDAIKEDIPG